MVLEGNRAQLLGLLLLAGGHFGVGDKQRCMVGRLKQNVHEGEHDRAG